METNKLKGRKAVWIALVSVVVLIASGVGIGGCGSQQQQA
jgi:hypothetical protein